MATKKKNWNTGTGSVTIQYGGQGDGEIIVTSDPNSVYEARSMQVTVKTTDGSGLSRSFTVNQAAKQRIDISAAVVTASNQTYSGSAKTPTPTVTLNGNTVPSSGYDVAYSNNTNAGTATITITGKGDYTGTATGTFTINKATPSYTAPTYRSLTYSGSAQYLTTTGSTSDGTIQYSSDGTNWHSTRRQGTDAGSYTTYWRLVGDSNHTDISATSISTTIAKATPSYTAPSLRTGLTYSGNSQYLTTSGSTSDGTIYYSTDGSNWYISRRTAKNAGSYDCYWKLKGDSNHTDIDSTYLGTTSIAKASRSISWISYPSSLYVGRTGTLSATASEGGSDGTISYSSSNSSKASVSGSTLTAVASGTCTIYASISEGTNYLSASTSYTLAVNAIPSGFVDMGVSVFWAEKNIGAPSIFSYDSNFYSWGNTDAHTPTSTTSFSPYDWGNANSEEPYASSAGAALTGNIPLSNDVAYQNLGSSCHMPSVDNQSELFNNVKYIDANGNEVSGTDKRVTVNGVVGLYLESKINGNRLFLPCCGAGKGTSLLNRGILGFYWSKTYASSSLSYDLYFGSDGVGVRNTFYRYIGMPVRAVRDL